MKTSMQFLAWQALRLVVVVCLFQISPETNAQAFKGGFLGGINASQVDNDGVNGFGKLGLHAGAFIYKDIIPGLLEWQMELRYSGKGSYRGPTQTDPSYYVMEVGYVEMPLSLNYIYKEKIRLEFGFSPDVLLREVYRDQDGFLDTEYSNELNRFGLNVFAGLNYFFLPRVALTLRYQYSVFPFYKFTFYTPRYRDSGLFHDLFSFGAAYHFGR